MSIFRLCIVIDSALQEAYQGTTLMNDHMNGEFPRLKPGANAISWTGTLTEWSFSQIGGFCNAVLLKITVHLFKNTEYRIFLTKADVPYIMPAVGGDQPDDLQAAAGSKS